MYPIVITIIAVNKITNDVVCDSEQIATEKIATEYISKRIKGYIKEQGCSSNMNGSCASANIYIFPNTIVTVIVTELHVNKIEIKQYT